MHSVHEYMLSDNIANDGYLLKIITKIMNMLLWFVFKLASEIYFPSNWKIAKPLKLLLCESSSRPSAPTACRDGHSAILSIDVTQHTYYRSIKHYICSCRLHSISPHLSVKPVGNVSYPHFFQDTLAPLKGLNKISTNKNIQNKYQQLSD